MKYTFFSIIYWKGYFTNMTCSWCALLLIWLTLLSPQAIWLVLGKRITTIRLLIPFLVFTCVCTCTREYSVQFIKITPTWKCIHPMSHKRLRLKHRFLCHLAYKQLSGGQLVDDFRVQDVITCQRCIYTVHLPKTSQLLQAHGLIATPSVDMDYSLLPRWPSRAGSKPQLITINRA